jgi:hypothetical protein
VAAVSAVVVAVLAVLSATRLRRVTPSSEVAESEPADADPGPATDPGHSLSSQSGKGTRS